MFFLFVFFSIFDLQFVALIIIHFVRSRWHELIFGSVVNRLLRESIGADIQVVPERAPHHQQE
jgi:hypothetical protein